MGFKCPRCGRYQSNMHKAGWIEKDGKLILVLCDDCAAEYGLDNEHDSTLEWKALTPKRSAEGIVNFLKEVKPELFTNKEGM